MSLAAAHAIIARLEAPAGWLRGFEGAGRLIGIIALVAFALSFGNEFRYGTLRSLLTVQSNRFTLFTGKLAGLGLLLAAAIIGSMALGGVLSALQAPGAHVHMDQWSSGLPDAAGAFFNVWVSAMAWGSIGALLAMLFKSNAPAIGVGVIYGLLGEPIIGALVNNLVDGIDKWLPASLLATLAQGGNPNVKWLVALAFGLVYGAAAGGSAVTLLATRDVTG